MKRLGRTVKSGILTLLINPISESVMTRHEAMKVPFGVANNRPAVKVPIKIERKVPISTQALPLTSSFAFKA